MKITLEQISYNISNRKSAIKYIVIHDTGNKSMGATAVAHYNYFNSGNRNSSADFFVDSKQIMQINDYKEYCTWHCGDGNGKYGITNQNSIGVEICVNSDGNYLQAYKNAVELTKWLMKELNIPAERVVRHYDASRKKCPASMSGNDWAYWQDFKNRISGSEELSMTQYEELKEELSEIKEAIVRITESKEEVYHTIETVPNWGKSTMQKLIDKGLYNGSSKVDLNLPESLLRTLVINDRAGLYD